MRVKNCLRISRSSSRTVTGRDHGLSAVPAHWRTCETTGSEGRSRAESQIIAEAGGFISANVLSSVSGTVKGIESKLVANGAMVQSILVENDGEEEAIEGFGTDRDATKLSKEEIRKIVKDAGIVGLGGAGFPTHVKLTPKDENAIDYVIVNGAECEPYLTSDYRTMMERPEQIIGGLKVMLQLFDNAKGVIGIENNKPEAIKKLTEMVKDERELRYVRFSPSIRRERAYADLRRNGKRDQFFHAAGRRRLCCRQH